MTDIAIRVQNLSKCCHIYDASRDRLKQSVMPHVQRLAGQAYKKYFREFWALKDVSFEIKKGETIREQIRRSDEQFVASGNTVENTSHEDHAPIEHTRELQESFDLNLKPSSTIEFESHGAYIKSSAVLTLSGDQVNNPIRGRTYRYLYTVRFTKSASNVRLGMLIKTITGVELGGGASASSARDSLAYVKAGSSYRVEFRFRCALNQGMYFLNAGVVGDVDGSETYLHRLIDIAMFRVHPDTENLATGIVDFSLNPA